MFSPIEHLFDNAKTKLERDIKELKLDHLQEIRNKDHIIAMLKRKIEKLETRRPTTIREETPHYLR